MATGASSKAHEGPFSAVVVSFMTPIIAITVVIIYYNILLRYNILGGATCQWGIVYNLLWCCDILSS